MINETIDLYGFFKKERGLAAGGQLKVFARSDSREIKKRIRPAILVLAGGGYSMLSEREAEPVALRFLDSGFCAFVLLYSIRTEYPAPLIEAMLAMKYIRGNAEKYGVDKNKVCAIGFSAGGHLAGLLATATDEEALYVNSNTAAVKPDAVVYAYPVVTTGEFTHYDTRLNISGGDKSLYDRLSVEKRVDKDTPPAFIWHTFEDKCVPVENSLTLAAALRRAGVPFALHIFEHGGHGLSLADGETNDFTEEQNKLYGVGKWVNLSLDWLKARGFKTEAK